MVCFYSKRRSIGESSPRRYPRGSCKARSISRGCSSRKVPQGNFPCVIIHFFKVIMLKRINERIYCFQVEKMARKLALVPEEGASLPIYLLSCLQSFLIVQTINPIPKSELEDAPIDVEALNTFDILHRAR